MNQRPPPQRHGKGAFSCRARIANEISRRRGDDHRNDKQCGAIINHRPTDPAQLARASRCTRVKELYPTQRVRKLPVVCVMSYEKSRTFY